MGDETAAKPTPVSLSEWRIIDKLRELRRTYAFFKLTIFAVPGKHAALDMEWSPRVRLEERERMGLDE